MNTPRINEQGLHTKPHWAWLAPVRMFVIVIIAFGYASTMPRGPSYPEYLRTFGYDPSWYGIAIIFMISGFLALQSLQRHGSALKFLGSRLFRNLPVLALFAALVILIVFPLFGVPTGEDATRTVQHMHYFIKVVSCFNPNTLTPGLLDNALYMCIIQGGLWTFRWGLIAFVGTAILWAAGGLRDPRILLIVTLGTIITYAALLVHSITHAGPVIEFSIIGLRLAWAYVAGMCAYAYRDRLPRTLLIPAVGIGLAAFQYYILPWTPFLEITAELAFGYLVFLGITHVSTPPLWAQKIPDLSLGLYIFNWPASQLILLMIPSLSPLGLFAFSLPATFLCAYCAWAIVSRPINFSMERRFKLHTT